MPRIHLDDFQIHFEEILLRLPPKPLLRFRSISKPWQSVIDSHEFTTRHHRKSPQTVIFKTSNGSFRSLLLDQEQEQKLNPVYDLEMLKPEENDTKVFGSCNGLLFISRSLIENVLWNPSTRTAKVLPLTLLEGLCEFDTTCIWSSFGFGVDEVHDDYKVVRLMMGFAPVLRSYSIEFKVYSLKTDSWKKLCLNTSMLMEFLFAAIDDYGDEEKEEAWPCAAFVNGSLHWLFRCGKVTQTYRIYAFDLAKEKFHRISLPESILNEFWAGVITAMKLWAFDGCLCLCCFNGEVRVGVWVMEEYRLEGSWSLVFSVDGCFRNLKPLVYSRKGERVLLEKDCEKLVWYDLRMKSFEDVNVGEDSESISDAHLYAASLVRVASGVQEEEKRGREDDSEDE